MDSVVTPATQEIFLRLAAAAAAGSVIGLNRELHGKPAGLRTHALVTLGSAVATLACLHYGTPNQLPNQDALSRVIQGIITGIGFLGAGVIMREQSSSRIHGLTTAATIWVAASLGIVCAIGHWPLVLMATGWVLAILVLGSPLEKFISRLWKSNPNSHDSDHEDS
ncbi:MAG TPA: MgtC/SapB family protein [Blastocatellia bacterium]|nr:MgtC/SapB family protein [Blastocatellia bacterium]